MSFHFLVEQEDFDSDEVIVVGVLKVVFCVFHQNMFLLPAHFNEDAERALMPR